MIAKTLTQDEYAELQEILAAAQEDDDRLNESESDFVDKFTDRVEQYGIKTFISEAQFEWLRKIGRKVGA